MYKSICFLSTSLWEDPGFVIIEAAFCNTPIISSDCENGPKEILPSNDYGYIFGFIFKKIRISKRQC